MLENLSRNVRSLTHLELKKICDREGGSFPCSSNMDSIMDEFLKNNSMSLTTLELDDCRGLTSLTLGVALEELSVGGCPDLTSINVVEDSVGLKGLMLTGCPKYEAFPQSVSSTLARLRLGRISEEFDEFSLPTSSSSVISFPKLTLLTLYGGERVKSILPTGELDDLSSTFPALTRLEIIEFEGIKALPDSLAKLPYLESLFISECKNLESLPAFDQSNSLQSLVIYECSLLTERYKKSCGPEWFKIQHVPHIKW